MVLGLLGVVGRIGVSRIISKNYIYEDKVASDSALREWVGLNRNTQEPPTTHGNKKQRCQLRFDTTGYME